MSRHRATRVRPRYGRLALAGTSLVVTLVALLGGVGLLPSGGGRGGAAPASASDRAAADQAACVAPSGTPTPTPTPTPTSVATAAPTATAPAEPAIPAGSGAGKRIVFSQAQQRVWLIGADEQVARTYLVSGSVLDNLDPGRFSVYSRSRWAVGVQDSGVMQYFVRFTQGPSGAAIGFHSIPSKNGDRLQTAEQLGTPQSHGCIRQAMGDAVALWHFAPTGTAVDVVA